MYKRQWLATFSAICALSPIACLAQEAQPAPTPAPAAPDATAPAAPSSAPTVTAVIPANTLVLVTLNEDIKAGKQKTGDPIAFTVDADVRAADGTLLIAAGAPAAGTIVSSSGAGSMSKNAKLSVSCDYATAIDGSHVAFASPVWFKAGGGTQAGNFLAGGLLFGSLMHGSDESIDQGKTFTMVVAADTQLTISSPATIGAAPTSGTGTVQILTSGRHQKPYPATIKSYSADKITITNDKGETKDVKMKDVKQITVGTPGT